MGVVMNKNINFILFNYNNKVHNRTGNTTIITKTGQMHIFSSKATLEILTSFHQYVCIYVCPSGLGGNVIFSIAN